MGQALDILTDEHLKKRSPKELARYYYDQPGTDSQNKTIRAIMRISIIRAYEEAKEMADAEVMIRVLYQELQSDFSLKELPQFILMRVGDFIRVHGGKSEQARVYYEEVLSRAKNEDFKGRTLFGLAALDAKDTGAQKEKAIDRLSEIESGTEDQSLDEKVLFLLASLHADLGHDEAVIRAAKGYLANRRYRRYSDDCRMLIGSAYRRMGRVDEALVAYLKIWSGAGRNRFTTKSLHSFMELLWLRNQSGDRQLAYERGYDFIKMTSNAIKRAAPEEKVDWQKIFDLVEEYEASPETQKIEE